ncbi:unnamed protein product [Closterium sp. Naga37s-1]|nr:unnamed protein product [Closterium sp. Naga37s-1]
MVDRQGALYTMLEEKAQLHWWRSQAARFLLRWPSLHLCHVINRERHVSTGLHVAASLAPAVAAQAYLFHSLSSGNSPTFHPAPLHSLPFLVPFHSLPFLVPFHSLPFLVPFHSLPFLVPLHSLPFLVPFHSPALPAASGGARLALLHSTLTHNPPALLPSAAHS